jgi:HEAT repeat protein
MKQRRKPTWKELLHVLQNGSELDGWEAAKALPRCHSRECKDALVALMRGYDSVRVSERAAYSLSWMIDQRFTEDFIECVRDRRQHETVRGQAAEGLGLLFDGASPRRRGWRATEDALLVGLSDASPTVRFWCCYGLGILRSQRAIAPLKHLREHDSSFAPGWWYVHEEAADALSWIAGEPGEDRIPASQLSHENKRAE